MGNIRNFIKKYSFEEIILLLIVASGAILSLYQYLVNRSLWLDEACLALNIIQKSSIELLQPLDYDQAAPLLFLQIEKLFSMLIPNSEYGLRLFPLLCFLASIWFFYQIVKRHTFNFYAKVTALSIFVFNSSLLYYSSEIKPYITDVTVMLAIFYFAQKDYKKETVKYYILGIIGMLSFFLSTVAPIILLTCGFYLLYDKFFVNKKKKWKPLLLLAASWLFAFFPYYVLVVHNHPAKDFMVDYWSTEKGFLPLDSSIFEYLLTRLHWTLRSLSSFNVPFNTWVGWGMYILFFAGIYYMIWKKQILLMLFICMPVLVHLFLSVLKIYPYAVYNSSLGLKFIVYTLPNLIIICSIGFGLIAHLIYSKLKIKEYQILVIFIPIMFFLLQIPDKRDIGAKKTINYIAENIKEDEHLYVMNTIANEFRYYSDIGFAKIKKEQICGYTTGIRTSDALVNTIDEIKQLRGKYWIFFRVYDDEEDYIANGLETLGYKEIKRFRNLGTAVFLYDFSENPSNQAFE
ncbi:MAG: glycosyltransferase family 39 protein [Dysgonamonadaceae bacterium]|jgi:hypothetical protein|nr:glycosyltransferase family 39 protein [Dysgonamonadaceae bacterium]